MGFPVRGRFDPRARLGHPKVILEKLSGATGSCNRTCIIAGQRWRALTSAESVKTLYFQRSPALGSYLISLRSVVGVLLWRKPILGTPTGTPNSPKLVESQRPSSEQLTP